MSRELKTDQLTAKVTREFHDRVLQFAFAHGISMSDVIRTGVTELMSKEGFLYNIPKERLVIREARDDT
jgi:hypothetical protein